MNVLLSDEQIRLRVGELARQIRADFNEPPITVLGVLTGSLLFVADLIRHLEFPLQLGFVRASSYVGAVTSPGQLTIDLGLMPPITGQHVLLLDDILDSGQTLHHLIHELRGKNPASLRVGVLLRKEGKQQVDVPIDYCGFTIPDRFVVGYGLDFNNQFRHLPHIAEVPETKTPS